MPTISQLPNDATVSSSDLFVMVHSGVTYNVLASVIANFIFTTTSVLTNGQLIIGNTGMPASLNTLTAGTGITISNGPGTITISQTGGAGFTWTNIATSSQALVGNNGYVANNASLITFTLPVASNFGDQIKIVGKGAGGWTIHQNAGQTIVLEIKLQHLALQVPFHQLMLKIHFH